MASVDNIWVTISFFVLAIFFIGILLFWNGIVGLNDELWSASSVGPDIKQNAQNAINNFDFILVIVYIGLHLGILVSAFLLRSHPVIYFVAIILVALLALIAAPISNAYEDLQSNSDIAVVTPDIPITNHIISQLPKYEIIWGFLTAIIMYGLARYEGFV